MLVSILYDVLFTMLCHIIIIDGQKIAKWLSKTSSKETCTTRKFLDELNASLSQVDGSSLLLSLADVLDPVSEFWTSHNQAPNDIPTSIKRDIIEAKLLLKRCKEELLLLQTEMQNVIKYYSKKGKSINTVLHELSTTDMTQFHRGCVALLKKLQLEVELSRSRAVSTFAPVISLPHECQNNMDHTSDSSESESDYDNSDDEATTDCD